MNSSPIATALDPALRWWRALAGRERMLVGAAALLATLTLAQLGWRALDRGLDDLRAEVAALRSARDMAQQLAVTPARPIGNEPPLAATDRAARAAGLGDGLKRLSRDDDGRVRVRLEGVALGAFARFVADAQRGSGARIEALLIARGAAPGLVDVTLTLLPPAG